jgi:hypothetical protein
MSTINKSRKDIDGHVLAFFDGATDETTASFRPCAIDEDFIGPGHSAIPAAGAPAVGYAWVSKIVKTAGTPTLAIMPNSAAGIVQLALDPTAESQEATLYANDQLNWDVTKSLRYEARVSMAVLPSLAGVEMVFGLQSAWIAGPDNAGFYVRFQANGSGLIYMQTKDGVNTLSVSTGVTLLAGAFHVFRIDATTLTDIRFFIDGIPVTVPGTFSFAAVPPSSILQPYASVYKAAAAGLGTMQIDMIQVAADRV